MFVQIFTNKTAFSLKGAALVAYSVYAVLLSFFDAYKQWLSKRRESLVELLTVKCAVERQGDNNELAEM